MVVQFVRVGELETGQERDGFGHVDCAHWLKIRIINVKVTKLTLLILGFKFLLKLYNIE